MDHIVRVRVAGGLPAQFGGVGPYRIAVARVGQVKRLRRIGDVDPEAAGLVGPGCVAVIIHRLDFPPETRMVGQVGQICGRVGGDHGIQVRGERAVGRPPSHIGDTLARVGVGGGRPGQRRVAGPAGIILGRAQQVKRQRRLRDIDVKRPARGGRGLGLVAVTVFRCHLPVYRLVVRQTGQLEAGGGSSLRARRRKAAVVGPFQRIGHLVVGVRIDRGGPAHGYIRRRGRAAVGGAVQCERAGRLRDIDREAARGGRPAALGIAVLRTHFPVVRLVVGQVGQRVAGSGRVHRSAIQVLREGAVGGPPDDIPLHAVIGVRVGRRLPGQGGIAGPAGVAFARAQEIERLRDAGQVGGERPAVLGRADGREPVEVLGPHPPVDRGGVGQFIQLVAAVRLELGHHRRQVGDGEERVLRGPGINCTEAGIGGPHDSVGDFIVEVRVDGFLPAHRHSVIGHQVAAVGLGQGERGGRFGHEGVEGARVGGPGPVGVVIPRPDLPVIRAVVQQIADIILGDRLSHQRRVQVLGESAVGRPPDGVADDMIAGIGLCGRLPGQGGVAGPHRVAVGRVDKAEGVRWFGDVIGPEVPPVHRNAVAGEAVTVLRREFPVDLVVIGQLVEFIQPQAQHRGQVGDVEKGVRGGGAERRCIVRVGGPVHGVGDDIIRVGIVRGVPVYPDRVLFHDRPVEGQGQREILRRVGDVDMEAPGLVGPDVIRSRVQRPHFPPVRGIVIQRRQGGAGVRGGGGVDVLCESIVGGPDHTVLHGLARVGIDRGFPGHCGCGGAQGLLIAGGQQVESRGRLRDEDMHRPGLVGHARRSGQVTGPGTPPVGLIVRQAV